MSEATPQIVEACSNCGQAIDVTDQEPFSEVSCPACGHTMRARAHFNNFSLLELLGEGGMGSVFKAIDLNLQRKVALKILKRTPGSNEAEWAKLAAEARVTATVNHPNVVKVFSFGEDHGQFYLAMELVEKGSLDGLMVLQSKVSEAQVLDVGIQIGEGLQAAYEHGLIHRDIKPGNILFAGPKLAKIVDFGLARVLAEESEEAGELWGTPFYVSPEKLDGKPEDFRSDIYSLGGTLFHALAGRPPFDARTASMVVLKHIKSQAVNLQSFAPNISDETAYVINRMLNKDPDQRYSSYDELLAHLRYARQQLQKRNTSRAEVKGLATTIRRRVRSTARWVWGAAAALALVSAAWFFVLRPKVIPAPAEKTELSIAPKPLQNTAAMAREALAKRDFAGAQARYATALAQAGRIQPLRNWLLAQLGLASALAGDPAKSQQTFAELARDAGFDLSPAGQPLSRFFFALANQMSQPGVVPTTEAEAYGDSTAEVFGLLAVGVKNFQAGDREAARPYLEAFLRSRPTTPDDWPSDLKPLAESLLAQ